MDINTITLDPIVIKFDDKNPNWSPNPEYNRVFLHGILVQAIDRFRVRGHFFVNEFLDLLGEPRTPAGQLLGWHVEKPENGFVEFAFTAGNNIVVRIIPTGMIWDRI